MGQCAVSLDSSAASLSASFWILKSELRSITRRAWPFLASPVITTNAKVHRLRTSQRGAVSGPNQWCATSLPSLLPFIIYHQSFFTDSNACDISTHPLPRTFATSQRYSTLARCDPLRERCCPAGAVVENLAAVSNLFCPLLCRLAGGRGAVRVMIGTCIACGS